MNGDHDFTFVKSCSEVTHRFGHFFKLINAVDDRRDLAGFDEVLEFRESLVRPLRHQTHFAVVAGAP